jgi:hypothetical protein
VWKSDELWSAAAFSMRLLPSTAVISSSASTSSFDWKSGNLPVRKKSRITPADHTSRAARVSWAAQAQSYTIRTTALLAALEQDLGRPEPARTRAIRLALRADESSAAALHTHARTGRAPLILPAVTDVLGRRLTLEARLALRALDLGDLGRREVTEAAVRVLGGRERV